MTTTRALGLESGQIGNPHHIPAEMDKVLPVRRDVPGYSETAFLTSWNANEGIGLFLHMGRCQQDIEMWWAQVLAYLPDGRIASDRTYGRAPADNSAVRTGNFTLEMLGERGVWRGSFDGAVEVATPAEMSKRPIGSGIARPMRFEFTTSAAGPMWDMYTALGKGGGAQDFAQGTHTQQLLHITGHLTLDGVDYPLDGIAGNDHSSGPRSMGNFGHHHFFLGAYPGGTIQCLSVFSMAGDPLMEIGSHTTSGSEHPKATLVDVPIVTRVDETSGGFEATLIEADGTKLPIQVELLHTLPLTLNDDGDNINGLLWDGPDVLALVESRVKFTMPDGSVGFAHLERSTQRSRLA